jgi:hypothetical protein
MVDPGIVQQKLVVSDPELAGSYFAPSELTPVE